MIKARENKEKKCIEIFHQHWYKIEDEYYPSVTSVLQCINKGQGYDEWLKAVGHNAEIITRKAQESGSKLHHSIELLLKGHLLEPHDYDEKEWIKLCNFVNWWDGLEIEPIAIEEEVYSKKLKIAGTADLICKIENEYWVLDFKTGNNVYSTSGLQVAAYSNMYNAMQSDIKITKCGIVHIGALNKTKKDLSNKGVKVVEHDLAKNTKLFLNTLEIYNNLDFRTNPPQVEYPMELTLNANIKK